MEPKRTRSAGGIVIGDGGTVAFVMSENSRSWLFPKGHVDEGEDEEDAARREIREEAGLTGLEYLDDLGEFTRPVYVFEKSGPEEKTIHMFLFAAPVGAKLAPSMEITDAHWIPLARAMLVLGSPHEDWFPRDRAWFASVFERVRQAVQRD
ncbi:MAG: NUDIX domain-containing protein [Patescibacteria group bacterium]|nr:NUDIX domain-containing protein [Patescibacteria group bacterium]MDE1966343.1 NUDIX domain-containing protein [Patescibacteria group bacterium]